MSLAGSLHISVGLQSLCCAHPVVLVMLSHEAAAFGCFRVKIPARSGIQHPDPWTVPPPTHPHCCQHCWAPLSFVKWICLIVPGVPLFRSIGNCIYTGQLFVFCAENDSFYLIWIIYFPLKNAECTGSFTSLASQNGFCQESSSKDCWGMAHAGDRKDTHWAFPQRRLGCSGLSHSTPVGTYWWVICKCVFKKSHVQMFSGAQRGFNSWKTAFHAD